MDIIDILLAKSLTPQGQINTYAARAQKAVSDSATAVTNAQTAIDNIETITEQTQTNNELALDTLERAEEALEIAQQSSVDAETIAAIEAVATEAKTTAEDAVSDVTVEDTNTSTYKKKTIKVRKKGTDKAYELIKNYTTTGFNEDGSMTQKAITQALANINPNGAGSLSPSDEGSVVVVGENGSLEPSIVTEQDLINLINGNSGGGGSYDPTAIVGLSIDYVNKTCTRTKEAASHEGGTAFDQYPMYGGRTRCNVSDAGEITAFYGDANYREDGSNGQVMVYQPKFYYKVENTKTKTISNGTVAQNQTIELSAIPQTGFKIHPLFIAENGDILDYVLISAFEGSCYHTATSSYLTNDENTVDFNEDKLSSIANVKPISGVSNNLTMLTAEQLATNRGTGWHITNFAAESALQMLATVEYGSLNSQSSIGLGISEFNSSSANASSLTGSTSSLGNTTGNATSTINIAYGEITALTEAGKVAVSYRGMENPWGNMWRFIGGALLSGGIDNSYNWIYIANSFNYTTNLNDYTSCSFAFVTSSDWVSGFGVNTNSNYDWLFIPVEAIGANSAVPIGDFVWSTSHLNALNCLSIGGAFDHHDNNGLFYYAGDQRLTTHSKSQSARLMYIPSTSNAYYSQNYSKWANRL